MKSYEMHYKGNFGLWYNKFVPLNNFVTCKTCDQKGDEKNPVTFYSQQYKRTSKDSIAELLKKKHISQAQFCECFSTRYETVVLKGKLQSPLVTGIGESHPHEVSMVFDHNMGIPYIPASGIKGIVRFAHALGLLNVVPREMLKRDKEGKEFFDDEEDWTNIPALFGTQGRRGDLLFMDVYPEKVPDLHVDIMNPHYGDYYSVEQRQIPPGDYLTPKPIKFLTVSGGTVFIFRALVKKERGKLLESVKRAFVKALTEEGVGAKTAVGYGLFETLMEEESESVLEYIKGESQRKAREAGKAAAAAEAERLKNLTEDDKMIERIEVLQKNTGAISALVAKCLKNNFQPSVYGILKEKLINLGEWKPAGSRQRKEKMRKRNEIISEKLS